MRMKRAAAFTLAGLMAVSMHVVQETGEVQRAVHLDSTEETKNEAAATAGKKDASEKLVVWTLADDLKQFAERYCEKNPDVQIETVTIAPADYPTKIQTPCAENRPLRISL